MAVYENSRYLTSDMYYNSDKGTDLLSIRPRATFIEDNYTFYEWCEGDTLDGIAYKFYGESALRWAILDANPEYRSEFNIEVGDMIAIPDYEEVVELINVE